MFPHSHPHQLQDREVLISLLVGAKYGMSQVINHKLNVISTLVEFSSISRVELLSESDKVSLLRISLHDMKVWKTLDCIMVSIIHKHVGIYTLTQIENGYSLATSHLRQSSCLSKYRSFHCQNTNSIQPAGLCGSYTI